MTFLVSHPTGNTFVSALLEELHKKNLLSCFYTTIGLGLGCDNIISKIFRKRKYDIPDDKIRRLWMPEIQRLLIKSDQESNRRRADRSYNKLDTKTSREITFQSAEFIHAYEDGACKTFRKAKELGIQCSYELPIAYWSTSRRLLSEEVERYPEWEPSLETTRTRRKTLVKRDGN